MERRAFRISGFLVLLLVLLALAAAAAWFFGPAGDLPEGEVGLQAGVIITVLTLLILVSVSGFVVVNPNEGQVIQFFGRYVGSITRAGFHWTVPFSNKEKITLRVRNFESARLKVSDADGNPVEIAAVVVYRVTDTFKASFAVDDHVKYVAVQAETAVRHLATSYPYEAHEPGRASLRDGEVVSQALTAELRDRVERAGVEVLESRVTHLAYAPEIAQAMLARQQANAIVAARFKIVEGAVGMVSNALELLREQDVVELDEERKAQMVSNLLVVLCGDRATQPVVNAGSLY
jgi:regulator of protease activity HflC (stomatin/prohibitin superfamily)